MLEKLTDPKKLTRELQSSGLPVASVSSSGRVDFSRALTKHEMSQADNIIKSHDPNPTEIEIRIQELKESGIDFDQIVLALWDLIIKGDSAPATALKSRMDLLDPSA